MMATAANTYIAVVDDDASVCRAMARLLRASGFNAITYASAEEFLDDQKRPVFDCLVVDIELARLSGVELQRQLSSRGEHVPTIFITANDDPDIREQAERLGCVAYLRKTSSGHELLQLIRDLLSKERNET